MYPNHASQPRLQRNSYEPDEGIDWRMWVPLQWFDWSRDHAWYGYWDNASVLAVQGADVKASFRMNDRGQMYFYAMNLADEACQADFALDLAALGLPVKLYARDAVTHEAFEITDGRFALEFHGWRPRVLMIAPEPVPQMKP
ncbi:MAG: hypothetical protein K9N49_08375 [Candidatus Marinimicrobia bacterium]|nr:hypothetical protein [Candidatus Neomarinimicrobiota bacterium]